MVRPRARGVCSDGMRRGGETYRVRSTTTPFRAQSQTCRTLCLEDAWRSGCSRRYIPLSKTSGGHYWTRWAPALKLLPMRHSTACGGRTTAWKVKAYKASTVYKRTFSTLASVNKDQRLCPGTSTFSLDPTSTYLPRRTFRCIRIRDFNFGHWCMSLMGVFVQLRNVGTMASNSVSWKSRSVMVSKLLPRCLSAWASSPPDLLLQGW